MIKNSILFLNDYRKCPICSQQYHDVPVISRLDKNLEICPSCGNAEATFEYSFFFNAYNPKNIKENLKEVGEYIERLTDEGDYFYKYLVKIREQLSSLLECCV